MTEENRDSDRCRVSIIIAVHNAEDYIVECIDSLLAQTIGALEVIVCDDGSTDRTGELLERYATDDRVVVVHNPRAERAASARNRCLSLATGEFIAIQDADDRSVPERVERQLSFLERHAEFAMVGSQASLFDGVKVWGQTRKPAMPDKRDLLSGLPFVHASLMLRASALREVGGYRVARETRRNEDYDLILRLFARGYRGYNLDESLYEYRVDENTIKRRRFRFRIDEAIVRARGFKMNRLGWRGAMYTVKPLVAGLFPRKVLFHLRRHGRGIVRSRD